MSRAPTSGARRFLGAALAAQLCLSACGGGGGGGTAGSGTASAGSGTASAGSGYSLSATIHGLNASGLVLSVNGSSVSVSSGATTQLLANALAQGETYSVTVVRQPSGETCTLTGNTGTMPASAVSSIVVSCTVATYTIGGSVTGLGAGSLVLLDNGADATPIGADATTFTLGTPVAFGGHYAVTVQAQPTGLVCTVSNGVGTVGPANVTDITIACLKNMTLLYSFAGPPSSGINPYAGVLQGNDGELYGTTEVGGAVNLGSVFVLNTSGGAEALVHSFTGILSDGSYPYGPLIKDSAGNLYGTTETGGSFYQCSTSYVCQTNFGSVFRINPGTGAATLLYSFKGSLYGDGADPYAGLVLASNGLLFGTTEQGGTSGSGTVYRVNPNSGAEAALHSFAGGSGDGALPYAGLIEARDGNLYGTTKQGGATNSGTVYRINPATGAETLVYAFMGGNDGASPLGGLVQGKDGNLYGTTGGGGAGNAGTVFKIDPGTGAESVIHAFAGGSADGANPYAGVILAVDGNLYGTTLGGGANGVGTVFRIDPATGVENLVYVFAGGASDGAEPYGALMQAQDGKLYGTTMKGGISDAGTVFRITLQ